MTLPRKPGYDLQQRGIQDSPRQFLQYSGESYGADGLIWNQTWRRGSELMYPLLELIFQERGSEGAIATENSKIFLSNLKRHQAGETVQQYRESGIDSSFVDDGFVNQKALHSWYVRQVRVVESAAEQITHELVEELEEQTRYRSLSVQEIENRVKKVQEPFENAKLELQKKFRDGLSLLRRSGRTTKKRGNLPKNGVHILKAWLFDHFLHPYPTEDQKAALAAATRLSLPQISNWFINARVRIWRPLVESMHRQQEASGNASEAMQVMSDDG